VISTLVVCLYTYNFTFNIPSYAYAENVSTLQAPSIFSNFDEKSPVFHLMAGYLSFHLRKLETSVDDINVSLMKDMVDGLLEDLHDKKEFLPEKLKIVVPYTPDQSEKELGNFIIDCGNFRIRYYNPLFLTSEPESSYQVAEEKRLGRFLARQVLIRRVLESGAESVSGVENGKKQESARESQKSSHYEDSTLNFEGTDLEHYIYARIRLQDKSLTSDELDGLCEKLDIDISLDPEKKYDLVTRKLAGNGYDHEIIDFINGYDPQTGEGYYTHEDQRVRLSIVVDRQSGDAKTQSVLEAVSNSLDAFSRQEKIGQFSWGVKQALKWLSSNGKDFVEVYTKTKNPDPYRLVILKRNTGRYYISIGKVDLKRFKSAMESAGLKGPENGTFLKIHTEKDIPVENGDTEVTLKSIVEKAGKRFPYIPKVRIFTRINGLDSSMVEINGYNKKTVITGPEVDREKASAGKNIHLILDKNEIIVADNGSGMTDETISNMFVPGKGDKEPDAMDERLIQEELARVSIVRVLNEEKDDKSTEVSFSRRWEVVESNPVSRPLVEGAVLSGNIILEFGRLFSVSKSRSFVRISPTISKTGKNVFEMAASKMVKDVLDGENTSTEEKLTIINTLSHAFASLAKDNEFNTNIISDIKTAIKKSITPLVEKLEEEGYIILPDKKAFSKIDIPEGRKAIYLDQDIMPGSLLSSLRKLEAKEFPWWIKLGGEKGLLLVGVPFTDEALEIFDKENRLLWYTFSEDMMAPVIKTDEYVVVPERMCRIFHDLVTRKDELNKEEEESYLELLQLIQNITGDEIVTSYELVAPKPNIVIEEVEQIEAGPADEEAVNKFLVKPPVLPLESGRRLASSVQPSNVGRPEGAELRHYFHNGEIRELGTGKVILKSIKEADFYPNGYARIVEPQKSSDNVTVKLVKFTDEGIKEIRRAFLAPNKHSSTNIMVSPDGATAVLGSYAWHKEVERFEISEVIDLTPLEHVVHKHAELGIPENQTIKDPVFSPDSKYMAAIIERVLPGSGDIQSYSIYILPTNGPAVGKTINIPGVEEIAFEPFGELLIYKFSNGLYGFIDPRTGELFGALYDKIKVDSKGKIAVCYENDSFCIYHIPSKKMIDPFMPGGERITGVSVDDDIKKGSGYKVSVSYEGEANNEAYCIDENGSFIRNNEVFKHGDPVMVAEVFNELNIVVSNGDVEIDTDISDLDPLRPKETCVYRHERFNLMVKENIGPAKDLVIDALDLDQDDSGKGRFEINKDEEIIEYKNGVLKTYNPKNRRVRRLSTEDPSGYYEILHIAEKIGNNFISLQPRPGPEYQVGHWYVTLGEEPILLDIDFRKYAEIRTDGKYFVFIDPDTGEAIYVDSNTGKIRNQRSDDIEQMAEEIDFEYENRYSVVIRNSLDKCGIDLVTGEIFEGQEPYKEVRHIYNGIFFGIWHDGAVVEFFDKNGVLEAPFVGLDDCVFKGNIGKYTLIEYSCGGQKHNAIIDCTRPDVTFHADFTLGAAGYNAPKITINKRGEFFIMMTEDGDVYKCDPSEGAPPRQITTLIDKYDVDGWSVNNFCEKADVIIYRTSSGKYKAYDIRADKWVGNDVPYDSIFVDTTGLVLISIRKDGASRINLIGGGAPEHIGGLDVKIAELEKRVFIKSGGYIFMVDKVTGKSVDISGRTDIELPEYWEEYTKRKKSVIDHMGNERAGIENPKYFDTDSNENYSIAEGRYIKLKDGTSWKISSLEEWSGSGYGAQNFCRISSIKALPLEGGKVWYGMVSGAINVVKTLEGEEGKTLASDLNYTAVNKANNALLTIEAIAGKGLRYYIITSEGEKVDISGKLPPNSLPAGSIDKYFLFYSEEEKRRVIFDPIEMRVMDESFAQNEVESDETRNIPGDAEVNEENRYQIVIKSPGAKEVVDIKTGKIISGIGPYRDIDQLSGDLFLGIGASGEVADIFRGKEVLRTFDITTNGYKGHLGKFIILEQNPTGSKRVLKLYDAETGAEVFWSFTKKMQLSASGKWLIHEALVDQISVLGSTGRPDFVMSQQERVDWPEYTVHDKADIIIFKNREGKYCAYDIKKNEWLGKDEPYDHIFIDQSGKIAICIDRRSHQDHIDGHFIGSVQKSIYRMNENPELKVSYDEDYVYTDYARAEQDGSGKISAGKRKLIINRKTGEFLLISPDEAEGKLGRPFPKYWEKYTPIAKCIVDITDPETNISSVPIDSAIAKKFYLDASYTVSLNDSTGGNDYLIKSLDEGILWGTITAKRIDHLKGDKVWWGETGGFINGAMSPGVFGGNSLANDIAFTQPNEERTALLAIEDPASAGQNYTYYIIDEKGVKTDITDKLPEHRLPAGTIGRYFLFYVENEKRIVWFDPIEQRAWGMGQGEEEIACPEQGRGASSEPSALPRNDGDLRLAFLATLPDDAPNKSAVIMDGAGNLMAAELSGADISGDVSIAGRLGIGRDIFLSSEEGGLEVRRPETDYELYADPAGGAPYYADDKHIIWRYADDDYKITALNDLPTKEDGARSAVDEGMYNDVRVTSSGRFYFMKFNIHSEPSFSCYDTVKDHNRSILDFNQAENIDEYYVHPDADIVIFTKKDGTFSFYDFKAGKYIDKVRGHPIKNIALDSSGRAAVLNSGIGFGLWYIGKTELEEYRNCQYGYVSVYQGSLYVYWEYPDGGVETLTIYNAHGNAIFDETFESFNEALEKVKDAGYAPPRYWERFSPTNISIWDTEKDDEVYLEDHDEKGEKIGAGMYLSEEYPGVIEPYGQRINKLYSDNYVTASYFNKGKMQLANLDLRSVYYFPSAGEPKPEEWVPLKGGKVWCVPGGIGFKKIPYVLKAGVIEFEPLSNFLRDWVIVNDTREYAINISTRISKHVDEYISTTIDAFRNFSELRVELINSEGDSLDISGMAGPNFYPVEANGRYFVFYDPFNGKFKYLDPVLAEEIACPEPGRGASAADGGLAMTDNNIFTGGVPDDLEYRTVKLGPGDIKHIDTAEEIEYPHGISSDYDPVPGVRDTYVSKDKKVIITYEGGKRRVMHSPQTNWTLCFMDEDTIVWDWNMPGDERPMIDICQWNDKKHEMNIRNRSVSRFNASSSGRFYVMETLMGDLYFFDKDKNESIYIREVGDPEIEEYYVHPRADVVIYKMKNGFWGFYDLVSQHNCNYEEFTSIIVGPSGRDLVCIDNAGFISHAILGTNKIISGTDNTSFHISYDDDHVFQLLITVSGPDAGHHKYTIYDKTGEEEVFGTDDAITDAGYKIPRFWYKVDKHGLSIYDMDSVREVAEVNTPGLDQSFTSINVKWPKAFVNPEPPIPIIINDSYCYKHDKVTTPSFTWVTDFNKHRGYFKRGRIKHLKGTDLLVDALDKSHVIFTPDIFITHINDPGVYVYTAGGAFLSMVRGVSSVKKELKDSGGTSEYERISKALHSALDPGTGKGVVLDDYVVSITDPDGEEVNITEHVRGMMFAGACGKYFMFYDPSEGVFRFIDPEEIASAVKGGLAMTDESGRLEVTSEEERKRLAERARKEERLAALWNDLTGKRDDRTSERKRLVLEVKSIYDRFLEKTPEGYEAEINLAVKPLLDDLFEKEDNEVKARLLGAVQDYSDTVNLKHLIFHRVGARMQELLDEEAVDNFLEEVKEAILPALKTRALKLKLLKNYFKGLFDIALSGKINPEDIRKTPKKPIFNILSLGWEITSAEKFVLAERIAKFIEVLDNAGHFSGELSIKDKMNLVTFLSRASDIPGKFDIVSGQIDKILDYAVKNTSGGKLIKKMITNFRGADAKELIKAVSSDEARHEMGELGHFVYFMTNESEPLPKKEKKSYKGFAIKMPEVGIKLSQIMRLELGRKKHEAENAIMDIEYLIEAIEDKKLPEPSESDEKTLLTEITHRESGAFTAEIVQNSKEATSAAGEKGELLVSYHIEDGDEGEEYVEEYADNGTGALKEVALLINRSTKSITGEDGSTTGFFGSGKYTALEDRDRVEIITKRLTGGEKAFKFVFSMDKNESGVITGVNLTGIERLEPANISRGLTIRLIKKASGTMADLEHMLSKRSLEVNAALSQDEDFTIYTLDYDGNKQRLRGKVKWHDEDDGETEIMAESDFSVPDPDTGEIKTFGKFRVFSSGYLPNQIVDASGLRVGPVSDKYLALVPDEFKGYVKEFGITFQVPLVLTHDRSEFKNERYFMPYIRKYITCELMKILVKKTLTDAEFTFMNRAEDFLSNDNPGYWYFITEKHKWIVDLAALISENKYKDISYGDILKLVTERDPMDEEQKLSMLMYLIEVEVNGEKGVSIYKTRLRIFRESRRGHVDAARAMFSEMGRDLGNLPSTGNIDRYYSHLVRAQNEIELNDQKERIEAFIMSPEDLTPEERVIYQKACLAARLAGLDNVVLLRADCAEHAFFTFYKNNPAFFIRRDRLLSFRRMKSEAVYHAFIKTVTHEIGHWFEAVARYKDILKELKTGIYLDTRDERMRDRVGRTTHHRRGIFEKAVKMASGLWLMNYEDPENADEAVFPEFARHPFSNEIMPVTDKTREDVFNKVERSTEKNNVSLKLAEGLMELSNKDASLLAIDENLGEGAVKILIDKLKEMSERISGKEKSELEVFIKNLRIISGRGAGLSERIKNLTDPDKGGIKKENVLVLTADNDFYEDLLRVSTIVEIEKTGFNPEAYMPIMEIMLFSVLRHLNYPGNVLENCYENIPNVMSISELTPQEMANLWVGANTSFTIRLIPNAMPLDAEKLRDLYKNLTKALSNA